MLLPSSLVGPKWDAAKSKWKWVLSANYVGIPAPPFVYDMYVNASVGKNGFEPKYGETPCPPAPYSIWIEPIQPDGSVPYVVGLAATVENSLGDTYRTDEYDLAAPCMLVELGSNFQYVEGIWRIIVTATITQGVAPYSYVWAPSGATAGGKHTDHSVTYALDRAEPVSVSVKVTDARGCSATGNIVLSVADIEHRLPSRLG